jgi:hypothetical protein
LVFVHGLLGNSQSWAFQYQHFARTHRVIAWDAPGFGQSDMVEPSLDAYVSALRDFLDTFGEQPIDLVGHSMGGTVASEAEVGFLCDWILARLLPHHATIAVPLSIIPGSRATARYSERGRDGWPPPAGRGRCSQPFTRHQQGALAIVWLFNPMIAGHP